MYSIDLFPTPPVNTSRDVITPSDLSGCRHRVLLRRVMPELAEGKLEPNRMMIDPDWEFVLERLGKRIGRWRRRQWVAAHLPTAPRIGDKLRPTTTVVTDPTTAVEDTLEAICRGDRLILNAQLEAEGLAVNIDLLVRMDSGIALEGAEYAPVTLTGHRAARKMKNPQHADCRVVSVGALGLGKPIPVQWKHRAVGSDSQRLGLAHVVLNSLGVASDSVGIIGRAADSNDLLNRCFFFDATRLYSGLLTALSQPLPGNPSRVKECKTCEFHNHCRAQLLASEDISLLLPGDKNKPWREAGINSLRELANTDNGEAGQLAQAWLRGDAGILRPTKNWLDGPLIATDNAVEIDIDMEAHPNRGTFLWGAFAGNRYIAFPDFSDNGDAGGHVAHLWSWLMWRKQQAEEQNQRFTVWVYAAEGEKFWLRHYARTFGGQEYEVGADAGAAGVDADAAGDGTDAAVVRMPTLAEVDEFLGSEHFADVFAYIRRALAGTDSLGLKTIAPVAGFHFSQEGVDGRAAVDLFEIAIAAGGTAGEAARRTLERYNADDCVATRTVRAWLRSGAPGVPRMR